MIRFQKKKPEITAETLSNTFWISTFLALILSIPPLGLLIGIYSLTGNLIIGGVIGFGVHFVTLAFSNKISKFLVNILN